MTSSASSGKPGSRFLGFLRLAALIALLAGALGSVGFTLRAGHRNPSRALIGLFLVWVLSPFAALVLANLISKDWSLRTRATLYGLMLAVSLGSLAIYGAVALGPPRPKTAFVFVIVPPSSWLLMVLALSTAAFLSRRRPIPGDRG